MGMLVYFSICLRENLSTRWGNHVHWDAIQISRNNQGMHILPTSPIDLNTNTQPSTRSSLEVVFGLVFLKKEKAWFRGCFWILWCTILLEYSRNIPEYSKINLGHTYVLLIWNMGIFQKKFGTYPLSFFLGYHGILEYSIFKTGHTNIGKSEI